ncbi:MAG: site-specific DNA-methyltransferase [Clostridia bacterium]|nr:site-specific DNA-methyltransferase [Clostridia bacterium]
MPTLEWIGKDKVINHHQEVPYRILDKKYTYNAESSENMIIHGDNLLALKSLLPQYEGQIDCIYIDPPYNTAHSTNNNQRWVYNDNVDDPHIKKWLGEVVGDEGEDLSRHDKWLCMMYPRLVLLYKILSKEGVIFISIDDNEFHNLKYLLDDIFGRKNHITTFAVENNPKGRKNNSFVSEGYEYCLLYCKNRDAIMAKYEGRVFQDVFNGEKKDIRNLLVDQYGSFKQSKRQVSGLNKSNALCSVSKIERCFTIYYQPNTESLVFLDEYDSDNDSWILSKEGADLLAQGYVRYTCNNNSTGKPSIPLYSKETLLEKHSNHSNRQIE